VAPGAAVTASAVRPLTPAVEAAPVDAQPVSGGVLGAGVKQREYQMIIDVLRSEHGRRKEAADRLGISPRTLRYKLAQMRDAGLDVEASLFAGV